MEHPLYIFDIDGTLANCEHRLHHIQGESQDWDAFYDACIDDAPIAPIAPTITVLQTLSLFSDIWFFTGRIERVREPTREWLCRHICWDVEDNELMMRPDGDTTADDALKELWLNNMLDADRNRLVAVFDDRKRIVDMWRRNDVQCYQVAEGDF